MRTASHPTARAVALSTCLLALWLAPAKPARACSFASIAPLEPDPALKAVDSTPPNIAKDLSVDVAILERDGCTGEAPLCGPRATLVLHVGEASDDSDRAIGVIVDFHGPDGEQFKGYSGKPFKLAGKGYEEVVRSGAGEVWFNFSPELGHPSVSMTVRLIDQAGNIGEPVEISTEPAGCTIAGHGRGAADLWWIWSVLALLLLRRGRSAG